MLNILNINNKNNKIKDKSSKAKSQAKFQLNKTNESGSCDQEVCDVSPLQAINPFLEINELKLNKDQDFLDTGDKVLSALNHLRLGMLNGELNKNHMLKIKDILQGYYNKFELLEVHNVVDEIILRAEIEIAKFDTHIIYK
ncbi:MAG: flagellar assembly protein FliX [Rickettsiaceae bacterium]